MDLSPRESSNVPAMSISTGGAFSARATRPAERALFRGLLDDAAVFPPGLAPLPRAVADHLAGQRDEAGSGLPGNADLVGPLLVPASAVDELTAVARSGVLRVGLVGRPGTDLTLVERSLDGLREDDSLVVTGVEVGWAPGWPAAAGWGVPVSVEVPAGAEQPRALEDVREHTGGQSAVQAKLRTGATDRNAVPTDRELATFIRSCIDVDLSFKLTGGLHHAVANTTSDGEGEHGFLNVLAATRSALNGADVPELATLLAARDVAPLLDIVTRMSEADASVVRAFFTGYGCCNVLDPIADLTALGLIKETV